MWSIHETAGLTWRPIDFIKAPGSSKTKDLRPITKLWSCGQNQLYNTEEFYPSFVRANKLWPSALKGGGSAISKSMLFYKQMKGKSKIEKSWCMF